MTTAPQSFQDMLAAARARAAVNNKQRPAKIPSGRSVWRILPGWRKNGDLTFYHPYGQHFVKDMHGDIKAVLVCNEKTYNKPCDICEMIAVAMKNAEDDVTRNRISESKAGQPYLVNAVRLEAGQDSKVEILPLGTMLFNQFLEILGEHTSLLDPTDGLDIVITKDGAGLNTKYTLVSRSAANSKPVPQSVLMNRVDLDEYVKEDQESKVAKAIETIGSLIGITPPSAQGQLTGPVRKVAGADLDDNLPEHKAPAAVAKEVEDAEIVQDVADEPAAPAKAQSSTPADIQDVDDAELMALLEGL